MTGRLGDLVMGRILKESFFNKKNRNPPSQEPELPL
jgi:hypothetical protein